MTAEEFMHAGCLMPPAAGQRRKGQTGVQLLPLPPLPASCAHNAHNIRAFASMTMLQQPSGTEAACALRPVKVLHSWSTQTQHTSG